MNDFDLFSNRTTDFGHRSKWIVVSEESVKDNLTTWTKDLENVAFVSTLNMVLKYNAHFWVVNIYIQRERERDTYIQMRGRVQYVPLAFVSSSI